MGKKQNMKWPAFRWRQGRRPCQGEVPHIYWFCGIFWNEKVEAGGEWQEEVQPSETPDTLVTDGT